MNSPYTTISVTDITALESELAKSGGMLIEEGENKEMEAGDSNFSFFSRKSGFTLIEMIGVVAIIAVLAALMTPKVFESIDDSKVSRFVGTVPTFTAAVTGWYKDIGTLKSLDASGVATTPDTSFQDELISTSGNTALLWAQWDGPYVDSVETSGFGSVLTIETNAGTSGTSAPIASDVKAFDLDDDQKNDMAGKQVVSLKLTGLSSNVCTKIDRVLDKGFNVTNRATSGRVKYWGASGGGCSSSGGTTLCVYIASN